MKPLCLFLLLLAATLLPRLALAQDFIYEPKNPAFGGGNPFNYSWLLSAATAQNAIADPAQAQTAADPLAQFANNLNQQILSQLTNRLITSQFGQGTLKPGSYSVGGYQVQVSAGAGGSVVILVTDTNTGNQTTVTIPGGI